MDGHVKDDAGTKDMRNKEAGGWMDEVHPFNH